MIVQQLEKKSSDSLQQAYRYYSILSALNNLNLTEREIQLIAFMAVKGSISIMTNKEAFCELYGSSFPTINNIVSKLKQLKIFVKDNKDIIVNPLISLDFTKDVVLQIKLVNDYGYTGQTIEHASKGVVDKEAESEIVS